MFGRSTFTVSGSYGDLVANTETGAVLSYEPGGDYETADPDSGYGDIARFDVAEWRATYTHADHDIQNGMDVLDIGFWNWAGDYFPPEAEFRAVLIEGWKAAGCYGYTPAPD